MSDTVRGKFRCNRKADVNWGQAQTDQQHEYVFSAVYEDGNPEHVSYAKSTPVGKLEITVTNPAVEFEVGALYYLDIVKA